MGRLSWQKIYSLKSGWRPQQDLEHSSVNTWCTGAPQVWAPEPCLDWVLSARQEISLILANPSKCASIRQGWKDYFSQGGEPEDSHCAILSNELSTAKPCDVVVSKELAGNILKELEWECLRGLVGRHQLSKEVGCCVLTTDGIHVDDDCLCVAIFVKQQTDLAWVWLRPSYMLFYIIFSP